MTGAPTRNYEPEVYYTSLTPEKTFYVFSGMYQSDRICMPYTYYYPQSNTDASDVDETSDITTDEETSSAHLLTAVAGFLLLL